MSRTEAAVHAARLRLRPILMTSLALIFAVVFHVACRWLGAVLRGSRRNEAAPEAG